MMDELRKAQEECDLGQAQKSLDAKLATTEALKQQSEDRKKDADKAAEERDCAAKNLSLAETELSSCEVLDDMLDLGPRALSGLVDDFPGLKDWLKEKKKVRGEM